MSGGLCRRHHSASQRADGCAERMTDKLNLLNPALRRDDMVLNSAKQQVLGMIREGRRAGAAVGGIMSLPWQRKWGGSTTTSIEAGIRSLIPR